MTIVNPPPQLKIPRKFLADPELRSYSEQQRQIMFQLWQRTGGGTDIVAIGDNDTIVATMPGLLTADTDNALVTVLGFHTSGDGGGGDFFFDPLELRSNHNGGTIVDPTNTADLATWDASDKTTWFTAGAGNGCWIRLFNDVVNVAVFGAKLDGVENDSLSVQNAGDSIGNIIFSGTCKLDTAIVFTSSIRMRGEPGHKIIPSLGLAGGNLFAFSTNDVDVEGITVDGAGETFTPATGTTRIFFGDDGVTKLKNHRYVNNKILNCSFSDGNTGASNAIVTHGIYVDDVDNVEITWNKINTTSGAAIFLEDIVHLQCNFNTCTDNGWYPIHVDGGIFRFSIDHNEIISNIANGVFFGGGIDLMNQHIPLHARSKFGTINNNHFKGAFSYGAVMRIFSCESVKIKGNTGDTLSVGTVSLTGDITIIRIDTRGTVAGTENGPVHNITVEDNTFTCPTTAGEHKGVYVSNQWQVARVPATHIIVKNKSL